jgi:hypothetical protein
MLSTYHPIIVQSFRLPVTLCHLLLCTVHAGSQPVLLLQHCHAEFSIAHETIQRMLARCQLVQDTLLTNHPQPKHSTCNMADGSNISSSLQPATPQAPSPVSQLPGKHMMHLTMRSQLLFEAPATATAKAQTHSSGSNGCTRGGGSSSGGAAAAVAQAAAAVAQAAAGAGDVKQQQDRQHSAWDGAVDLNPGFQFRPGASLKQSAPQRHMPPSDNAIFKSALATVCLQMLS